MSDRLTLGRRRCPPVADRAGASTWRGQRRPESHAQLRRRRRRSQRQRQHGCSAQSLVARRPTRRARLAGRMSSQCDPTWRSICADISSGPSRPGGWRDAPWASAPSVHACCPDATATRAPLPSGAGAASGADARASAPRRLPHPRRGVRRAHWRQTTCAQGSTEPVGAVPLDRGSRGCGIQRHTSLDGVHGSPQDGSGGRKPRRQGPPPQSRQRHEAAMQRLAGGPTGALVAGP